MIPLRKVMPFGVGIALIFFLSSLSPPTQSIVIPDEITLGGVKMKINEGAKKQIQTHLNFLLNNKNKLENNLKLARLYFPLVSKILKEEGLPDDFKYLLIQENDIFYPEPTKNKGFWNLNPEVAQEIGLNLNDKVDERFNLINSTLLVSKHLRNKNLYFKNWVFTLLTLDQGFEKTRDWLNIGYLRKEEKNSKVFLVNEKAHPFIRKFIAYKLFYEYLFDQIGVEEIQFTIYKGNSNKTLRKIARQNDVYYNDLKSHNRWLFKKRIPGDKLYHVLIPKSLIELKEMAFRDTNFYFEEDIPKLDAQILETNTQSNPAQRNNKNKPKIDPLKEDSIKQKTEEATVPKRRKEKHVVKKGETLFQIAKDYHISLAKLRECNNLLYSDYIYPDMVLIICDKGQHIIPSADLRHIVKSGETLYSIARKYGTSVSLLRIWNNLNQESILRPEMELIVKKTDEVQMLQSSGEHPTKESTLKDFQLRQVEERKRKNLNDVILRDEKNNPPRQVPGIYQPDRKTREEIKK